MRIAALSAICASFYIATVFAAVPDPVAGRKFAQIECGGCHVIAEKDGKAPPPRIDRAAPRFAALALDPAMTPEKIRATLKMPHGSMANLVISEKDTDNIISYIATLRPAPPKTDAIK